MFNGTSTTAKIICFLLVLCWTVYVIEVIHDPMEYPLVAQSSDRSDAMVSSRQKDAGTPQWPIPSDFEHFCMFTKQVCTHGLVSFGSAVTSTSGAIPQRTGPPVIAVNWRYFNTHGTNGRVFYRSTSSGRCYLFISPASVCVELYNSL